MTTNGRSERVGYVQRGETAVRYVEARPARPADGPALVLLHGTGGTSVTHFSFLLPMLARHHHVIAIDFAPDASDAPLTVEDLAGQAEQVLEEVLDGAPAIVCGYSLGAVVAAAVAARSPSLVAGLVLICGWAKTDPYQQVRNQVWHTLRKEGSAALAEYSVFCAFGAPYLAGRTPAEVSALVAGVTTPDSIDAHMDLNRRVDIESSLGSIQAPTLVLGATFDTMVPVRHSKLLWGAIQNARYAELPTGHAVMVERPAQVYQLLTNFCADPDAVPAGSIVTLPTR